jgi:hypothetical protein
VTAAVAYVNDADAAEVALGEKIVGATEAASEGALAAAGELDGVTAAQGSGVGAEAEADEMDAAVVAAAAKRSVSGRLSVPVDDDAVVFGRKVAVDPMQQEASTVERSMSGRLAGPM